jgi:hypothetical protein
MNRILEIASWPLTAGIIVFSVLSVTSAPIDQIPNWRFFSYAVSCSILLGMCASLYSEVVKGK